MNRESCRKKNNLWDWDEVALYSICVTCVFILGVIVYLCCVCGKVSIMADNSKKDVDESGIVADVDSDNSTNDQTQGLGSEMLMKFLKEMREELKREAKERVEESDRKFNKILEQVEELDRKANERAKESDRKFEELKTQVERQAQKCSEQTEKIEEAVTSLKNEVEAENKRFHEKLEENEETVKKLSETVRHLKGKTEYDIGEINSKVNGIREELDNRETKRNEKIDENSDENVIVSKGLEREVKDNDEREVFKEQVSFNSNFSGQVREVKAIVVEKSYESSEMNCDRKRVFKKDLNADVRAEMENAFKISEFKEERKLIEVKVSFNLSLQNEVRETKCNQLVLTEENHMEVTQVVSNGSEEKFMRRFFVSSAVNWFSAPKLAFPVKYVNFWSQFLERDWSKQISSLFEKCIMKGNVPLCV